MSTNKKQESPKNTKKQEQKNRFLHH